MKVSTQQLASPPTPDRPSLGAVWAWALAGALLGYLVCRRRAWLTLFIFPTAAALPLFALMACPNEEGISIGTLTVSYCTSAAAALVLAVSGVMAGAAAGGIKFWSLRELTVRKQSPSSPAAQSKSSGSAQGGAV